MARPCKDRNIKEPPCYTCFKPSNAKEDIEKINLRLDEFEAIRLLNLEGYSNIVWAKTMWISWPTFNRLTKNAHKKLTDAIVNWKCIYITCDKEKN